MCRRETICIELKKMAFYEQKVGLSLEFSMTSFLSRVAAFWERDVVGLHETE